MSEGSYECDVCGMVLLNSKELAKHKIVVHIDEKLQCQSCNRFFEKNEFDRHAIMVHGVKSRVKDNSVKKEKNYEDVDDLESMLLKQAREDEQARKRTRGPYRKSSSTACT